MSYAAGNRKTGRPQGRKEHAMTYEIKTGVRKEIAQKMEEITGEKPEYTGVPRCAYVLRGISVEKDGFVKAEEDADMELIGKLIEAGLIAEREDAPEDAPEETAEDEAQTAEETSPAPEKTTISVPLGKHRAESIKNLVFTIYSKGSLISKATGGSFSASDRLVGALKSGNTIRMEEVIGTIHDAEEGELIGLTIEEDKVTFDGFPLTDDPGLIKAWTALVAAINQAAIKQNHVRAKKTEEENEKFAFRTWLTRIGMNGSDLKEERSILYQNLSGHTAFRTQADQERWTKRQNEKRDALRQRKEAAHEEAEGQAEGQAEE